MQRPQRGKAAGAGGCERPWAAALPVTTPYDEAAVAAAIATGADAASPDEYLHRVRYEARRIPDVVTLQVVEPSDGGAAAAAEQRRRREAAAPAAPTAADAAALAWEAAVVKDFVALRGVLAAWQARTEQDGLRALPRPPPGGAPSPPSPRDAGAWSAYTRGRATRAAAVPPPLPKRARLGSDGRRPRHVDIEDMPSSDDEEVGSDDDDDDEEEEQGTEADDDGGGGGELPSGGDAAAAIDETAAPADAAAPPVIGTPPWLRTLLGFDQVATCRALRRLVAAAHDRFDASPATHTFATSATRRAQRPRDAAVAGGAAGAAPPGGADAAPTPPGLLSVADAAWLYAFLARLERPLVAETAALVRELFLLVHRQRAALQQQQLPGCASDVQPTHPAAAILASLDVLRAVAGRYFEQRLPGE